MIAVESLYKHRNTIDRAVVFPALQNCCIPYSRLPANLCPAPYSRKLLQAVADRLELRSIFRIN